MKFVSVFHEPFRLFLKGQIAALFAFPQLLAPSWIALLLQQQFSTAKQPENTSTIRSNRFIEYVSLERIAAVIIGCVYVWLVYADVVRRLVGCGWSSRLLISVRARLLGLLSNLNPISVYNVNSCLFWRARRFDFVRILYLKINLICIDCAFSQLVLPQPGINLIFSPPRRIF